jgi:hypothetical protein
VFVKSTIVLEEPVKDLLRIVIAAVVGAVVALAVVVGQPALASQVHKAAAKNSVSSKSIKDGTIKTKDLNAEVTGPLAKAGTALQSVPDNSVTTNKLANAAVTNPKIADNAVTGPKVTDHSLKLDDVSVVTGSVSLNFPGQNVNNCAQSTPIETGHVVTGALILVSQPVGVAGAVTITARESALPTQIDIVACNVGTTSAFDPPNATYKWAVIGNGS